MTKFPPPLPVPPAWTGRLPATKLGTEKAAALVALGYPAVEPVIMHILEWLQDFNWPVAHVFAPFLAGIGAPLAGPARTVLRTEDGHWKYVLLNEVVAHSPELARLLRADLRRLIDAPTGDDRHEQVNDAAAEVLAALDRESP